MKNQIKRARFIPHHDKVLETRYILSSNGLYVLNADIIRGSLNLFVEVSDPKKLEQVRSTLKTLNYIF